MLHIDQRYFIDVGWVCKDAFLIDHFNFSNSFIIDDEETKETTNVNSKEVWKRGLHYHKVWRNFVLIFRSYIKHSKECFISSLNAGMWAKKTKRSFDELSKIKHSYSCLT